MNKYRAKPALACLACGTRVSATCPCGGDVRRFHSTGEAKRFAVLLQAERQGDISGLRLQPAFPLELNGVKVCKYVADFEYTVAGDRVVEDYKGRDTRESAIKRKLLLAISGINVVIIGAENCESTPSANVSSANATSGRAAPGTGCALRARTQTDQSAAVTPTRRSRKASATASPPG